MQPTIIQISPTQNLNLQLEEQPAIAADGLNSFSLDLYQALKGGEKNVFFSPLSLYVALLLLYEGARAETQQEFKQVLRLKEVEPSKKQDNTFTPFRQSRPSSVPVHMANGLWLNKKVTFEAQYLERVSGKYNASLEATDFSFPNQVVQQVNNWVDHATSGLISEIIDPGDIRQDLAMILANAIYFEGVWRRPFDKKHNRFDTFYGVDKANPGIEFMNRTHEFPYYENEDFQVVALPYRQGLHFCVLLPRAQNGLARIESELSFKQLGFILEQLHWVSRVDVSLPKFSLQTSYSSLDNSLKMLGLRLPFTGQANFTGITPGPFPIQLDKIIHKAYIEINEEKTIATAATTFGTRLGFKGGYQPTQIFKADHPFLFMIVDRPSKAVVFMGKVGEL